MAVIGGKFRDYVENQIIRRQKALAQTYQPPLSAEDLESDIDINTSYVEGIPTNVLKAFNSNTPWIRMASSVNITEGDTSLPGMSVYKQIENKELFEGFDWKEDNLAKNFVLFGGVNNNVGGIKNSPTGNTGNPLQKAYGFGYNDLGTKNSRGPVPLPGIQSVDFSYKNDGALAQASVKVKCFSPEQFQMIDILFQRPGYTVLLEFGHSVFLDNEGNLQYAGQGDYSYSTDPFKYLYQPDEKQGLYSLLDIIEGEKEKWDGNYEAFYARISKFNWSFNQDGSYDITVNLVGLGDVISSLRVNTLPPKIKLISKEKIKVEVSKVLENLKTNPTTTQLIEYEEWKKAFDGAYFKRFGKKATFGNERGNPSFEYNGYVYHYIGTSDIEKVEGIGDDVEAGYYKTNIIKYNSEAYTIGESSTIQNSLNSYFTYELRRIKENMSGRMNLKGSIDDTLSAYISSPYSYAVGSTIYKKKLAIIPKGVLGIINDKDKNEHNPGVYISFGVLLSMLQQFANQYSNGIPLIQFDFNFISMDKDTNYIKKYEGLFSSDPSKILIPYGQIPSNVVGEGNKPLTQPAKNRNQGKVFNKILKSSPFFTKDKNKGRLAYVYLHTDYISTKYSESNNPEDGGVLVLEFLKEILKDINSNLNNLNNFKVLHNKETNKIQIVSETPISKTSKNLTRINTFGVTKTEGSFVKNISLDSELSDNYATQVSVGAQNNGSNSQSNSLSFSTYNKGLIDRITVDKSDTPTPTPTSGSSSTSNEIQTWNNIWTEKTSEVFKSVYVSYNQDPETLSALKDLNNNIGRFVSGELTKKSLAPPPFFLPFNLKLTVHGLSGVQIYNSFKIDGKVLPVSYNPEQIELTIKNLSHTVDSNGWVTKIDTFPRPIFEYKYENIKTEEVPTVSVLAQGGVYGETLQNLSETPLTLGSPTFVSPLIIKPDEDPAPIINALKLGSNLPNNTPTYKANKLNLRNISSPKKIHQLANNGALVLVGDANTDPTHFAKGNSSLTTPKLLGGKYYLAPAPAASFKRWIAELNSNNIPYLISSAVRFGSNTGGGAHGYGVAVDFSNLYSLVGGSTSPKVNKEARIKYPIYRQIAEIGARHGWYNPWRLSDSAGKMDELWHFEYWGSATETPNIKVK
jgi:hypothetical protein